MAIRFQSRLVLLECLGLIFLYIIFEAYKNKYKKTENQLLSENSNVELDIMLKEAEILKNNIEADALSKKIDNYIRLGHIIQSFGSFYNEREMFIKVRDIVSNFMGKGIWELKKYRQDDSLANYILKGKSVLIIDNLAKDDRFIIKSQKMSILAVGVKVNSEFWGTLEGFSYINNFFSDEDVEKLYIISLSISKVIENYYLYKKLKTLAVTDSFTGCYKQSFFKELLSEELVKAKINKTPLTLGILDIDFFKNINDKYGHTVADSVLQQFASILRAMFRERDVIARYGGDEFSFIMPNTNANEALKILEKIRLFIEKIKFYLPLESFYTVNLNITASFGFVSLTKENANLNTEDFIKSSDNALYKAKLLGRNRIEEYK
ncbi:MAG: sensor domain-containing diguanylate cyclase [Endomicrobium sp.]|nr:sensor domain-containing diguanylate cyclase [Endomicrobium sp.]